MKYRAVPRLGMILALGVFFSPTFADAQIRFSLVSNEAGIGAFISRGQAIGVAAADFDKWSRTRAVAKQGRRASTGNAGRRLV